MPEPAMVTPDNVALLADQYELTMVQAYLAEGMHEPATFDLFVRGLPEGRNYLLACGIEDALDLIEHLRFSEASLEYLRGLGVFGDRLIDYLAGFRFTGEVRGVREGTPCFGDEPIVEVTAPLPEAQLIETLMLNQVTFQTALASKASRVVRAARGRRVVDFGLRRMHGLDAGLKSTRAFWIAGVDATSNVLAGHVYGLPITGTMAHSYVEAHDDEAEAFRAFAEEFGETVLLIDTYDTVRAARRVVELSERMGEAFRIRAVRLDSGDLVELSRRVRRILDEGGLEQVQLFASGGLDEDRIARIVEEAAPIDGFGVGTHMGVSNDAPALDTAYKLVEYAGRGRMKLSSGKDTLPGRKQVYRLHEAGGPSRDLVCREDEPPPAGATPLLEPLMSGGERLGFRGWDLDAARDRSAAMLEELPAGVRELPAAERPYEVRVSERLGREADRLRASLGDRADG